MYMKSAIVSSPLHVCGPRTPYTFCGSCVVLQHNPIILLKQGTEATSGKGLILSNIRGCLQIVDTMKTTLGPRGQDKLFKVQRGTHITNDGATIISLLNVVHPAVKTLVDVSQAQDSEAGDGTTSVVLIAGGFLEEARKFIEDGVHPQLVVAGYKKASQLALEEIKRIAVNLSTLSPQEKENVIRRCAETSLNSKLLANHRELFGQIVYDAVSQLGTVMDKEMISIKKISGGSVTESELIHGVAFQKTFSYAGFENAPKQFTNPKILLLNLELELKAEKENAEIRVDDVKVRHCNACASQHSAACVFVHTRCECTSRRVLLLCRLSRR